DDDVRAGDHCAGEPEGQYRHHQQRLPGHGATVAGVLLRPPVCRHAAAQPRLRQAGRVVRHPGAPRGCAQGRRADRRGRTQAPRRGPHRLPRRAGRLRVPDGAGRRGPAQDDSPPVAARRNRGGQVRLRGCEAARLRGDEATGLRDSRRRQPEAERASASAEGGARGQLEPRGGGAPRHWILSGAIVMLITYVLHVEDKPGVLNRVSSLVRRRGYNIESLTVGHTDTSGVSRMTLVVDAEPSAAARIEANIYKLVHVLRVENVTALPTVYRYLALIKVAASVETRTQVMQLVDVFRARVVDVAPDSLMVEVTGTDE